MANEACRALITDKTGSRLLLAKRADKDFRGGRWSTLGGKIDAGETPEQAVVRESWEEAGLILDALKLYTVHINNGWTTYFYEARASGKILLDPEEHSEVGYFPEEEIAELDLAFDHLQVYKDFLRSR